MRANKVKQIWQAGGAVVNGWLQVPNSYSAEVMAHAGWDSLTVDMQHGCVPFESVVPMFQAIGQTDAVPMIRVPWNEPGVIMRVLDAIRHWIGTSIFWPAACLAIKLKGS